MFRDKIEKNKVQKTLKTKINSNKKNLTKINRKTTWRIQLIFKRISTNFKARREKRERRRKSFIEA
jgi:hypothetical protein